MPKLMYLPLDERPCNFIYPQRIAEEASEVILITPPKALLGCKKQSANIEKLWVWIEENIKDCSYMVTSIDMIIYGGIVPSRIHYITMEECNNRLNRLSELKRKYPSLKINAFNLIMRVPSYNSSEEEPEYYDQYGEKIYKYSWETDRTCHKKASLEENEELNELKKSIPALILEDYMERRKINHYINKETIKFIKNGIIDFLIIPIDDCSEYGFSALEQRQLMQYIERNDIQDKVYMYPSADDIGCTLTARVINEIKNSTPKVFVRYSSSIGPSIIPKYEDRPLGESVKYQILASGGVIVDSSQQADIILMVNAPTIGGAEMAEAPDAKNRDISYYLNRNLIEFVLATKYYIQQGKKCAIADVAFCNGADDELMRMMNKQHLLQDLIAYAGWNTSGNTLGTVISYSMIRYQLQIKSNNLFHYERLIEDWGYQANVRTQLSVEIENMGIDTMNLKDDGENVALIAVKLLNEFIEEQLPVFANLYYVKDVYFPWNRLFEIGISIGKR
ncbi:MAG TPA: DUF4127 family protein [Clostridiaceae bacterium]